MKHKASNKFNNCVVKTFIYGTIEPYMEVFLMKKGIIFDMDGTLWDSAENVAKSWNTIIESTEYGLKPLTKEDFYRVMGLTMDALGEALWPQLPAQKRKEIMDKCSVVENDYLRENGAYLYPNLIETLTVLKEKYHLYIVSNCQAGYIESFLDHYKLWDIIEDIECFGNNDKPKGFNIKQIVSRNKLDKAVYVGDIQGDYDSTMEAGINFIHAAYGFGKINTEVPEIKSFDELPYVADDVLG